MSSVNKIIIVGRLGSDPELKDINGNQVCNFSVATSETRKGEERTEWHRVAVWGRQAEPCARYLEKGRQVYVEGKLTSREVTNQDGSTARYYSIMADVVQFLGSRNESEGQPAGNQNQYTRRNQYDSQSWQSQSNGNRSQSSGGGHNEPIPF